ncbi:MAG TPA: pantoate--beta-alanine ligase [Mycobacteriales bacterium]|nr:pantoate--beta-alanine ligase [Mycobacteriales bacterium]
MTDAAVSAPVVARTRAELAALRAALPGTVAVVMTMGALHEGHAELVREARRRADSVIVTIFVNPLQFGPGEDYDRYPRTWDHDLQICARAGAALVFAPTRDELYPSGEPEVRVQAGPLGDRLEGEHRPGHFDGVLTVVLKLLNLTQPDIALYGEKDAQQLALIRHMVRDLDVPASVVAVATVRDADGLALSSRNRYLSAAERQQALGLSRALAAGAAAAADGPAAVLGSARQVLAGEEGIDVDYVELVDEDTWHPAGPQTRLARLLVAGRVGTTRLIDNREVDLGTHRGLKA